MSEKKKQPFESDQQAPPYQYEEDSAPPPPFSDLKQPPRPSLHSQRTEARSRRIQHLLTSSIEPPLYSDLLEGISLRIFLLVPSDILTQHPNLSATDIVGGLPNHASNTQIANVRLIRPHGPDNHAAFWHQPSVLTELASSLRARLAASGHKVENPLENAARSPPSLPPPIKHHPNPLPHLIFPALLVQKAIQHLLLPPSHQPPNQPYDPTASTNFKLGWRSEREDATEDEDLDQRRTTPLAPDEVRVLVKLRDVSFRVETMMGLLDSVSGRAVWVQVEVGC